MIKMDMSAITVLKLATLAFLVQVSCAQYEDIILDRKDITRLSQVRLEIKGLDYDRKCDVLEGELRNILTNKLGPSKSRQELLSAMISILNNRKLPFNNDQPILVDLSACLNDQSHAANGLKREVIASPTISSQGPVTESPSQTAMKEAIEEFHEVKSNVKDFGKDIYHIKSDSESHNELNHDSLGHHDHLDHSVDKHHKKHHESHSSDSNGNSGAGGFARDLAEQVEHQLDIIEKHQNKVPQENYGIDHPRHESVSSKHSDQFANGLMDSLEDHIDGSHQDQHMDQAHEDEHYIDPNGARQIPVNYVNRYDVHSEYDDGAFSHGQGEIVRNNVLPGGQRDSYASVNEYPREGQHSNGIVSDPARLTVDHLLEAKDIQLKALEHELSVKQEIINDLQDELQALASKCAQLANSPYGTSRSPIEESRFMMMKEQYEQAAQREEYTARSLNAARAEIAEKDGIISMLRAQQHNSVGDDDDDDDDDNRKPRKSFGLIEVAAKLQDKMNPKETLPYRCYKYYLAFDANESIDKETSKNIGKMVINGPVPYYKINNLEKLRQISDILTVSGIKKAARTGQEMHDCFLQGNLWWENNDSAYKGYPTTRFEEPRRSVAVGIASVNPYGK